MHKLGIAKVRLLKGIKNEGNRIESIETKRNINFLEIESPQERNERKLVPGNKDIGINPTKR